MSGAKVLAFVSIVVICALSIPELYARGLEGSPHLLIGLPSESPSSTVACSPEQPTVPLKGSVHLRLWVMPEGNSSVEPVWTVTAGTIQGHGNEVVWNLGGVIHEGIYHANAKLADNTICSVRIVVVDRSRSGPVSRETGRSFLIKGKLEFAGYGLYSYCLLGSRPTATTRDRYLKVLTDYMQDIEKISSLKDYIALSKLNITYLPIEAPPPDNPTASWLLEHYDYSRARILLDLLPGDRKNGIYFISSLKPLAQSTIPPYLYQDLSTVPTSPNDLMSWWIGEFMNQAAQEQFWQPQTGKMLALKLRTTVAVLGVGLPDVKQELKSWIDWIN